MEKNNLKKKKKIDSSCGSRFHVWKGTKTGFFFRWNVQEVRATLFLGDLRHSENLQGTPRNLRQGLKDVWYILRDIEQFFVFPRLCSL